MALNDILFSEEFMFEGEQADAYRARKEKEAKEARKDEEKARKRQMSRFMSTNGRLDWDYMTPGKNKVFDKADKMLKPELQDKLDDLDENPSRLKSTEIAAANKAIKRAEKEVGREERERYKSLKNENYVELI